jgi:hypothetical protein
MQEILARIHIKFTDANKNAEAQPYTEWDQLTFLKRNFSWQDHNGKEVCHAQIDKKSIIKMLQWYSVDTNCTRAQQIKSSIRSAAIESYLHGFEFYESMSELVYTSLEEYMPGSGDVMGFPPYAELEVWFMEAQEDKYRYNDPWWDDDFMQGYINCYTTRLDPVKLAAFDEAASLPRAWRARDGPGSCAHQ